MTDDWSRLDNAAKIFPSANGGANAQVFRFSCELKERIDNKILQSALDETIEIFEMYRYVMRRGFFWYYLEKSNIKPVVCEEHKPPCSEIYNRDRKNLLFSVTYFNSRINVEVYHVLSDGTGAMHFIRTLVGAYIRLKYKTGDSVINYDASRTQMKADSFAKYYSDKKSKKRKKLPQACKLKGARNSESQLGVITGHMNVKAVLDTAHKYNTTLTAFVGGIFVESIGRELSARAKKKDLILAVPVNLRQFFPSKSVRNFFSMVYASYNFSKRNGELNDIVAVIDSDLKENLTEERLAEHINTYSDVEHNFFAKITPLFLKDIFLRYAYRISMKQSTATLSNIGVVKMPEEFRQYIKAFDVYTGTNKVQICLCSYGETLSVSFTSPYVSTDIQRRFFRRLTGMGIDITVFSNYAGGDE